MSTIKSRWKQKGTGNIIHPETEVDQLKLGDTNNSALASIITMLLKAATTSQARSAIEAAAAVHTHSSEDITDFASDVITAIGEETLAALGVRYSITTNGYICFGDLFGGLILQWGVLNITNANAVTKIPMNIVGYSRFVSIIPMDAGTNNSVSVYGLLNQRTTASEIYVWRSPGVQSWGFWFSLCG